MTSETHLDNSYNIWLNIEVNYANLFLTVYDMGDSTVRMREYVGYIMIFMGTGLPASLSSLLRRNAWDTLAVLVCHQWSYQQSREESTYIPQRIYRDTLLLILGCRLVEKNILVSFSCPRFVTDNFELLMKEI